MLVHVMEIKMFAAPQKCMGHLISTMDHDRFSKTVIGR